MGLARELTEAGHECLVIAPSLIPTPAWRSHQDRQARRHHAGEDASRRRTEYGLGARREPRGRFETWSAREKRPCTGATRHAKRFPVSCCGRVIAMAAGAPGPSSYWRWLATIELEHPAQQVAMQEYILAIRKLTRGTIASSSRSRRSSRLVDGAAGDCPAGDARDRDDHGRHHRGRDRRPRPLRHAAAS